MVSVPEATGAGLNSQGWLGGQREWEWGELGWVVGNWVSVRGRRRAGGYVSGGRVDVYQQGEQQV